ncbi:class I SAM-dependent methyltransferase [Sphingomonas sp. SUN019]|uniref:class I SAM-dependent methyltransferase n=1 Tax=Sphingomonas sp. SUN019 TaxID=2937788 RepID=UPI0021644345|nr:class I SAM-dependent methyltransferase [Sphingomonas sp. SUN019]UVO51078.1 class I SAM-dependent methyltransferase [Sphingomonas sp. SUN019]
MSTPAAYDTIGRHYATQRQPDPRIAAMIDAALGDAASVINVGAGTGSYEPANRTVFAVEPSAVMRAQRQGSAAPCVDGVAAALPVPDASYDAAMAVLTLHHWPDQAAGLRELRRVARRRAVILSWVPDFGEFWLIRDYFPALATLDEGRFFPTAETVALMTRTIGPTRVAVVPVPADCRDGFLAAYWRRPEAYLDPNVRAGISSFHAIDARAGLASLANDLASGRWAARNTDILDRPALDLGYRLFVCDY